MARLERSPGKERPAKLIVTIDTEEDEWGSTRRSGYRCTNIERIPALQDLFDRFGVRPTYLVTYPVATDKKAVAILKAMSDAQRADIGAHCHPWNTPPFGEPNTRLNSILCNLPVDMQYAKMKCLGEAIAASFGVTPRSFKTGRFGYATSVAGNLRALGYRIDTSVTPYTSWHRSHGPDFRAIPPRPFRFSADDAFCECAGGDLVEVPTTIGFLQSNFRQSDRLLRFVSRPALHRLHLVGLLGRLGLLNKVWLSPELSDVRTMIGLTRAMLRNGYTVLNMVFHSPSLQAGLTPFTRTTADERRFLENLRAFLTFAREHAIEPIRLSEIEALV